MASLNTILDAVTGIIETHTGLRCSPIVDLPPVPCVMVYPDADVGDANSYYTSFNRGTFDVDVVAHVLYPTTGLRTAQRSLNDNISPSGAASIPQAIFQHPTLGTDPAENPAGTPTMTAHVARVSEYGVVTAADGTRLIGAKVIVHVVTRGDT